MYARFQVKGLLLLSDFNETLITPADFRKIPKNQIQTKADHWGGGGGGFSPRTQKASFEKAGSRFSQFWERT